MKVKLHFECTVCGKYIGRETGSGVVGNDQGFVKLRSGTHPNDWIYEPGEQSHKCPSCGRELLAHGDVRVEYIQESIFESVLFFLLGIC